MEIDVEKILNEHKSRRIDIMRFLCESDIVSPNDILAAVGELRVETKVIDSLESTKKKVKKEK